MLSHNFVILCPKQVDVLLNETVLEKHDKSAALSSSNMLNLTKVRERKI